MKGDPRVCRGDDRRSIVARATPTSCQELFLEKRVSIAGSASWLDSTRGFLFLMISPITRRSIKKTATEMDSLARRDARAILSRTQSFTRPAF